MRGMKQTDEAELTISVVEAGRQAGLGRNGSYDAARRGEIPTIQFGRRKRVPKKKWEQILNGEAA